MIVRLLKVALLGSAVGLAAHVPIATTALSTPRFVHVVGDVSAARAEGNAATTRSAKLSPEEQKFLRSAHARGLYARYGFVACGPFANYREDPNSTFMTKVL
jgi:putative acetyltransferase